MRVPAQTRAADAFAITPERFFGMRSLIRVFVLVLLCLDLPALPASAQQAPGQEDRAAKEMSGRDSAWTQPQAPDETIEFIKEEGLKRSQLLATLSYLTDMIGPRLTGSPQLKRANEWTRDKLAEWGLNQAHLEPWGPFGRGWSLERFSAQIIEPHCIPLIAFPRAWSPGTEGVLVGPIVYCDARSEPELRKYEGKVKGAIVMVDSPAKVEHGFEPTATRLTEKDLLKLADASEPPRNRGSSVSSRKREAWEFDRKQLLFLIKEGAAALLTVSSRSDAGTLLVTSVDIPDPEPVPSSTAFSVLNKRVKPWSKDAPKTLAQIVVTSEQYNRLVRLAQEGLPLKAAIDLAVRFHDDALMAHNTIAEIPGTDLKDEIVMLGAHLDSWHSGTGATDNGVGVAVTMEAVRIIQALKLKPRRTIRIALWTGEEQNLLGSRAYVAEHFGKPDRSNPRSDSKDKKNDTPAPSAATTLEREKFSVYFNLDNGTGRIRGVYLQGNEAVRPIFRKWLEPFRSTGASTLSVSNTGGTDHLPFDAVGLPGFQFIQDDIEYDSRTHHTNQDVLDRVHIDDLKQAAVVMASFVYNAAIRDEKIPRKPKPLAH